MDYCFWLLLCTASVRRTEAFGVHSRQRWAHLVALVVAGPVAGVALHARGVALALPAHDQYNRGPAPFSINKTWIISSRP
jgi:hypothetical protein